MFRYSWVLCGFVLLLGFGTAAPARGSSAVGAPVRVSPTTCSPTESSTWKLGSQGRIYELPETVEVTPNGTRLRTPPAVYGCLFAVGHPWRLNLPQPAQAPGDPDFEGVRWVTRPGLTPETTMLNGLWVAYRESFVAVDTGTLFVAATNLLNGKTSRCFAGAFNNSFGFSVVKVVVQRGGDFAWSSRGERGVGLLEREIVACDPSGARTTLDAGPGVDLGSLELRGAAIIWTDDGHRRSYRPR